MSVPHLMRNSTQNINNNNFHVMYILKCLRATMIVGWIFPFIIVIYFRATTRHTTHNFIEMRAVSLHSVDFSTINMIWMCRVCFAWECKLQCVNCIWLWVFMESKYREIDYLSAVNRIFLKDSLRMNIRHKFVILVLFYLLNLLIERKKTMGTFGKL